jgi:hypothetical protein
VLLGSFHVAIRNWELIFLVVSIDVEMSGIDSAACVMLQPVWHMICCYWKFDVYLWTLNIAAEISLGVI